VAETNYKGKWIVDYFKNFFLRLVEYKLGMSSDPIECFIIVTQNCNSKCIMCNYWMNNEKNEITVEQLRKILHSPSLKRLKSIALTGGEPLLRKDLPEIIKAVYEETGVKPTLATNGLFPVLLDNLLETHKQYLCGVTMSFDGVGDVHNKIRGKMNFEVAMKSLNVIKKHNFVPGVSMTLMRDNYDKLKETFEFFKEFGFTYKSVQNTPHHFGNNVGNDVGLNYEMKKNIVETSKNLPINNLYDAFMEEWLLEGKRPVCYAGSAGVVITSKGDIQPCIQKPSIGNALVDDFEKIWHSEKAKAFRRNVAPNCKECYQRCTTHSYSLEMPKWVIKYRLKKLKNLTFLKKFWQTDK